eukprot:334982-Amphidinium_carterae.1
MDCLCPTEWVPDQETVVQQVVEGGQGEGTACVAVGRALELAWMVVVLTQQWCPAVVLDQHGRLDQ